MLDDISGESKVLFVGEGNFSFSAGVVESFSLNPDLNRNSNAPSQVQVDPNGETLSFAKKPKLATAQFTASCYEDEKHGSEVKQANIEILRKCGSEVLFELDGTKLHEDSRTMEVKYSDIVFMFPHVGGKMKIDKNRALVLGFLRSCRKVLQTEGRVTIALARGQGGTPVERVKRKECDTWKIVDIAHEAGFVLSQVDFLDIQKFPSYSQTGYRSLEKGFHCEDSLLHQLRPAPLPELLPLPPSSTSLLSTTPEPSSNQPLGPSLYPPTHLHLLSMWLGSQSQDLSVEEILPIAHKCLPGVMVTVKELDRFSSKGRSSLTVEVTYTSSSFALGASLAWHLHLNVLGQSLVNIYGVSIR